MKKFFICRHCGNLVEVVNNAGVPVVCCGEKMEELVPNTVEASGEKHKPVVAVNGDVVKVAVGSIEPPMVEEHSIEWIMVETDKGSMRKHLKPGEPPVAEFLLGGDKVIAAFAYCNLHGLWMTEV